MGLYEGRLFSADGNLYADQRTRVGEKVLTVRNWWGTAVKDENGDKVTVTIPIYKLGSLHGREVKHVPGEGYVFVDRAKGDSGHHEDHHRAFVVIQRTAEDTDPHHFAPLATDPHYDPSAPGNTLLKNDPDSVAERVTGHTDAYRDTNLNVPGVVWVQPLPEPEPEVPAPYIDSKQPNES